MSNFALLSALVVIAVWARPVDAAITRGRAFSVNIRTRDTPSTTPDVTDNAGLSVPLFNATLAVCTSYMHVYAPC